MTRERRTQRRVNKLARPALQVKFCLLLVGVSLLSLLIQFVLVVNVLSTLAVTLPEGARFYDAFYGAYGRILLLSLAFALPLTTVICVTTTFKVVGPIKRFTMFLESIDRGERPPDCRIRQSDELQDFCELLNRVTAPLRAEDRGGEIIEADEREAA
jgi:nitrogen fixation/metabolism regulation signal transduction histidine kinase